jgi:hypothetical protein
LVPGSFLSFATASDLFIYAVGTVAALCTALPFVSIDVRPGHSAIVSPHDLN